MSLVSSQRLTPLHSHSSLPLGQLMVFLTNHCRYLTLPFFPLTIAIKHPALLFRFSARGLALSQDRLCELYLLGPISVSLLISKNFEFNMNVFIRFNSSMDCLIKVKNSRSLTNNGTILKREKKEKAKSKLKIFTAPTALGIGIPSLEHCKSSRKYYI